MEIRFVNALKKGNIKPLNLTFRSNEIVSIIGLDDSCKKTVLDILYYYDKNMSGEIFVDGTDINDSKKFKENKKKIYYFDSDLITNDINKFNKIKKELKKIDVLVLEKELKDFSLDYSILKRDYSDLSIGEKKKIILISMIISSANILLLNHPNSYLDYKSTQNLIKKLKEIKRKDKIVLINSCNSEFLLQVSDRVIVIHNNKVIDDNDKYSVFSNIKLMKKVGMDVPNVIDFENKVIELKNKKIGYRDSINDLIKDIYRNA